MGISMSSLVTKKEVMQEFYRYFIDNEKMVLLVNDMGFAVLDRYFEEFSDRVFNVGINEQATVGMSAGMALAGLIPIIYSQIPFITMRSFEQLRYDINEHKLNVKIIGIGADNYFYLLGRSHCMDNDDIKLISILRNFLILSPTKDSLKDDLKRMVEHDGPVYLRTI